MSFLLSSLSTEQWLVGSACSGGAILGAPPFSLVAQHVVSLSRAPRGSGEEGLLVEKITRLQVNTHEACGQYWNQTAHR